MTKSTIVKEAENYVREKFNQADTKRLAYHNMRHIEAVVNATREIAEHSNVSEKEKEILLLAAWLHDIGYLIKGNGHEEEGRKSAEEFLTERNYPEEDIVTVGECIMATRMPQMPRNKLEEIICDADLIHLADPEYVRKSQNLRLEWQQRHNHQVTDNEWFSSSEKFLNQHTFFTPYARQAYEKTVQQNLEEVNRLRQKGDTKNGDQ